jgi:uncharacterized delta-60 repeat protein
MRHPVAKPRLAHALTLAAALASAPALANYDGTLDTTLDPALGADPFWGVPGLFDYEVNLGGTGTYINDDTVTAAAVQTDGKIVVAGFSWNTYLGTDQNACVLARFNEDGSLDTDFGSGGRVVENFNPSAGENDCYLSGLALEGDGSIVAVGNTYVSTHGERALIERFTADGRFDTTFGTSGYVVLDDNTAFSAIVADTDGTLYAAGRHILQGFSDYDFYLGVFDADGGLSYDAGQFFDLGADHDDRAYAEVLQHVPERSCGNGCIILAHDELYLVGSAIGTAYGDGLANHDCAVVAYTRSILDPTFTADTTFGNAGSETIDFPMPPSNEGDNFCRAAVARSAGGIVVGGENYFISTLGGGMGVASNYALAEIDAAGNVTRQDAFAFFEAPSEPGIYNGIWSMAREPGGKLIVTGYAGTSDANRTPADAGVIRFNADFTRDSTFGNDGDGLAVLSLDGLGGLLAHQREWTSAIALDNRGHIVVAGLRSVIYGVDQDYDWLVGRMNTSDVIFRDGADGVVPVVR